MRDKLDAARDAWRRADRRATWTAGCLTGFLCGVAVTLLAVGLVLRAMQ
jgi:hypothetical protein